jgi:hypothetical protein
MKISSLHLLLTYRCTLECDHCFVWGSPHQSGTMSPEVLRQILAQASELGTIESIYFEGGEPFMCYATLAAGAREAKRLGFSVGIVSNGFWAAHSDRAFRVLQPLAGLVDDLLISSDVYHGGELRSRLARNAAEAARQLGMPLNVISIAEPEAAQSDSIATPTGQIPAGEHGVMYRGRAAARLAGRAAPQPWQQMASCPYENLREPGRIHVDPYGNLHICQGISLGNLLQTPLRDLCARYDPAAHPITGALLAGGPAELVRRYQLRHEAAYADACHLCDHARRQLRPRFADILAPDEMYGVPAAEAQPGRNKSRPAFQPVSPHDRLAGVAAKPLAGCLGS